MISPKPVRQVSRAGPILRYGTGLQGELLTLLRRSIKVMVMPALVYK